MILEEMNELRQYYDGNVLSPGRLDFVLSTFNKPVDMLSKDR